MREYDELLKGAIMPMPIKDADIVAWRLLVADMFARGHYDERNVIADAAMIIERLLKEREAKP